MDIQYLAPSILKPYEKVNVAKEFLSISDRDYQKLKESIASNGIRVPLVVHKKTVICGSTRLKIAQELGINLVPCHVLPDDLDELTLEQIAIEDNLARRHLATEQKARLALRLAEIESEKAKKREYAGKKVEKASDNELEDPRCKLHLGYPDGEDEPQEKLRLNLNLSYPEDPERGDPSNDPRLNFNLGSTHEKGKALEIAAKKAGISYKTLVHAKALKEKAPEEWEKVKSGEKSINRAYTDYRQRTLDVRNTVQLEIDILDMLKKIADRDRIEKTMALIKRLNRSEISKEFLEQVRPYGTLLKTLVNELKSLYPLSGGNGNGQTAERENHEPEKQESEPEDDWCENVCMLTLEMSKLCERRKPCPKFKI